MPLLFVTRQAGSVTRKKELRLGWNGFARDGSARLEILLLQWHTGRGLYLDSIVVDFIYRCELVRAVMSKTRQSFFIRMSVTSAEKKTFKTGQSFLSPLNGTYDITFAFKESHDR